MMGLKYVNITMGALIVGAASRTTASTCGGQIRTLRRPVRPPALLIPCSATPPPGSFLQAAAVGAPPSHLVQAAAALEGARGRRLDDGAVCQGVGVGDPQLDDVRAQPVQRAQRLHGGGAVGVAGHQEGDEGNPGGGQQGARVSAAGQC